MRKEFLQGTVATWQSQAHRQLTLEDAREISQNIIGFVRLLMKWDEVAKGKEHSLGERHNESTKADRSPTVSRETVA